MTRPRYYKTIRRGARALKGPITRLRLENDKELGVIPAVVLALLCFVGGYSVDGTLNLSARLHQIAAIISFPLVGLP